ncbi:hypothetical protein GCM10027091_35530 [Streptomyces daliensis]
MTPVPAPRTARARPARTPSPATGNLSRTGGDSGAKHPRPRTVPRRQPWTPPAPDPLPAAVPATQDSAGEEPAAAPWRRP